LEFFTVLVLFPPSKYFHSPMVSSIFLMLSNPSKQLTILDKFLKWYENRQNFVSILVAHTCT